MRDKLFWNDTEESYLTIGYVGTEVEWIYNYS
jgi:hypothetical protein